MAKFAQLIPSFTVPRELSDRLAAKFKGLLPEGAAFVPQRDEPAFYQTLEQYCAGELAKEFSTPAGQLVHAQILGVMSGEQKGVLLKGLPEDSDTKGLIMVAMRGLLGGERDMMSNPHVLTSPSCREAYFHRDNEDYFSARENDRSFMLQATAQARKFIAPLLLKPLGARAEDAVSHALKPDEILLTDNKVLQHSVGWSDKEKERDLMRLVVTNTPLTQSLEEGAALKKLRKGHAVPKDVAGQKTWLRQQAERMLKAHHEEQAKKPDGFGR